MLLKTAHLCCGFALQSYLSSRQIPTSIGSQTPTQADFSNRKSQGLYHTESLRSLSTNSNFDTRRRMTSGRRLLLVSPRLYSRSNKIRACDFESSHKLATCSHFHPARQRVATNSISDAEQTVRSEGPVPHWGVPPNLDRGYLAVKTAENRLPPLGNRFRGPRLFSMLRWRTFVELVQLAWRLTSQRPT
ncbi:hypothetical protein BJ546DRAFT_23687 [Cryomyces antarcticus]